MIILPPENLRVLELLFSNFFKKVLTKAGRGGKLIKLSREAAPPKGGGQKKSQKSA